LKKRKHLIAKPLIKVFVEFSSALKVSATGHKKAATVEIILSFVAEGFGM